MVRLGKFGMGTIVKGTLVDLSPGGLCLVADYQPKVDEELELDIVPRTWGATLTVPVRVRSVRPKGKSSLIGCEFLKRMGSEKLIAFF